MGNLLNQSFSDLVTEINRLCTLRAADYPARKQAYHDLYAKVQLLAHRLRQEMSPDWQPDANTIAQAKAMTPIFIGGYYKSGTTFVRDLLDHHDQMSVLPGDAKLLFNHRKIELLAEKERLAHLQESWIHRLVNPTGLPPFWLFGQEAAPYRNFLHYLAYWFTQFDTPLLQDITAPALAYFCANPIHSRQPRYWIDKTPMQEMDVDLLYQQYPEARFIHVVRNPLASLAARKKMTLQKNGRFNFVGLLPEFHASLTQGLQLKQSLKERYFIIRYEDILTDPSGSMKNIVAKLNIPFDKSLLSPTVNGIATTPNSAYQNLRQQGKIITGSPDRWRAVLTQKEVLHTVDMLGSLAAAYGYDWQDISSTSLWGKMTRRLSRLGFYTLRQALSLFRIKS
ncbi:MAG: sulfotransferase [Anaerolineales bacterium]|nr:sulfotransferase [Anaerolineales bacterium]